MLTDNVMLIVLMVCVLQNYASVDKMSGEPLSDEKCFEKVMQGDKGNFITLV